jgi:3-oxoacyl-[acyl-carrier-protein] synthase-3
LPPVVRTNRDLLRTTETSDAWIVERTGIEQRCIAPEDIVTSDMAAAAARAALDATGMQASELDMIVVATVTPDVPMPATAVFLQQKLGAAHCPAFDLSAACAGFLFGLSIADQFIATGRLSRILIVGVELLSRVVDWTNRSTCILFGDGAGAAVLGPSGAAEDDASPSGVLSVSVHTDGSLARSLWIPGGGSAEPTTHTTVDKKRHYVRMRGQDIFKAAVKNLAIACEEALVEAGLTIGDIDWVCAHQANKRIIDQVVARLGVPENKVLSNIARVGNTSSASIPILLDESVRKGTVRAGDAVLMCALGAGVSWGSAVVRM